VSLRPGSEYLTNMLPESEVKNADSFQQYSNIIIKVKKFGSFEHSDLVTNQIEENTAVIPEFVTRFEQKLVRISRLRRDVRRSLDLSVCSILTGRCRLYCRCHGLLGSILRTRSPKTNPTWKCPMPNLPKTRSPKTNPMRKPAMPAYWRWPIPHFTLRFAIGKKIGDPGMEKKIPSKDIWRSRSSLTCSFMLQRTVRSP
jgi:hypothetical protein